MCIRDRGRPAAPAGAGRKAVPLSGGICCSGQAEALDPGPDASAAGVGLFGPDPNGPAGTACLSSRAGVQHPGTGGPAADEGAFQSA